MATDDERRKVARRLRGGYDVVSDSHGRFWLNGTLFGMDITARSEEQIRDGLARLADLIEPSPPCEFWDAEEQECYSVRTVRPVDREALLALADEMDAEKNFVIVGGYARRIREALGAKS